MNLEVSLQNESSSLEIQRTTSYVSWILLPTPSKGPHFFPDPVFSLDTYVETQSSVGVPSSLNDVVPFGARVML